MKTTVATAVLGLVMAHGVAAAPQNAPSSAPAASATGGSSSSGSAAGAITTGSAAPAAPSSSNQKFVWAHHIVGVTQEYKQADWVRDVAEAKKAGIDGFALNMGGDVWQPQSIEWAYTAAKNASDFKMFFSFDMTSLPCKTGGDASRLAEFVRKYADHEAQAKYDNKPLVSTFGGERCDFGAPSVEAGWKMVRDGTENGMYFVPSTFMTPQDVKAGGWFDGGMQWDAAWPMDENDPNTKNDTAWMEALGDKAYMAPVSPFFFTYYGPETWNKNWIYRSDDWLMATRFEMLIGMRDKIDMIELVSWNDFGESHYVCDVPDASRQPNSSLWTENMPHTGLLSLTKYYADAFRTGSYPDKPEDAIWLWTRPHPKDATPTAPTLERPTRSNWTDDKLYVVVTLSGPATVEITSGSNTVSTDLEAGLHKLSVDSAPGPIGASITRDGNKTASYDSTGQFEYTDKPKDYNFNYFVASTSMINATDDAKSGDGKDGKSGAAPAIAPVGSAALAAVLATAFWAAI